MESRLSTIGVEAGIASFLEDRRFPGESVSDVLRRLLELPREHQDSRSAALFANIQRRGLEFGANATERYLLVLGSLYDENTDHFEEALDVRARGRVYFARTEKRIAAAGSKPGPRRIPGSPFWTLTNQNTMRKGKLLNQILFRLGYNEDTRSRVLDVVGDGLARQARQRYRNQRRGESPFDLASAVKAVSRRSSE